MEPLPWINLSKFEIKEGWKGANVHVKDNWGKTALLYALLKDHAKIVKIILDNGIDVNIRDERGVTPLMVVA